MMEERAKRVFTDVAASVRVLVLVGCFGLRRCGMVVEVVWEGFELGLGAVELQGEKGGEW